MLGPLALGLSRRLLGETVKDGYSPPRLPPPRGDVPTAGPRDAPRDSAISAARLRYSRGDCPKREQVGVYGRGIHGCQGPDTRQADEPPPSGAPRSWRFGLG